MLFAPRRATRPCDVASYSATFTTGDLVGSLAGDPVGTTHHFGAICANAGHNGARLATATVYGEAASKVPTTATSSY